MPTQDVIRIDICHSDDPACVCKLLRVLGQLGGHPADDAPPPGDEPCLGAGAHRYHVGPDELTVYKDAWGVDVAGPEPLVRKVLAGMCGC
jgi:hypothetical protein